MSNKTRYETYEEALTAGRLARAAIVPLVRKAAGQSEVRGNLAAEPCQARKGFKFSIACGTLRIQSVTPDEYTVYDDQNPLKICRSLSELCDEVQIILF